MRKLAIVLVPLLILVLVMGGIGCGGEAKDSDSDGWTGSQEQSVGTNPYMVDTDGDGYWDPQDPNPLDVNIPIAASTPTPAPTPTAKPTPTPMPTSRPEDTVRGFLRAMETLDMNRVADYCTGQAKAEALGYGEELFSVFDRVRISNSDIEVVSQSEDEAMVAFECDIEVASFGETETIHNYGTAYLVKVGGRWLIEKLTGVVLAE